MMYRIPTKKERLTVGVSLIILGAIPAVIGILLPGPLLGATASIWALPLVLFGASLIPIGIFFVIVSKL